MRLTSRQKSKLLLALHFAIEWEFSIIDAHENCTDDESVEYKKLCTKNIKEFDKLVVKIKKEG